MSCRDGTAEVFAMGDCREGEEGAELEPAWLVVHAESALGEHIHPRRRLLFSLLPY